MAKSQQGKVAVITGAALGIGRAYAKRLAEDGCAIVAVDLQPADETVAQIKSDGGNAVAVRCDVSVPADIAMLAREVEKASAAATSW